MRIKSSTSVSHDSTTMQRSPGVGVSCAVAGVQPQTIQHHHLLGYFKHRNARLSRCGKTVLHIRTTHNSQAAETKRFLRTGEARSRSINLKARALAIASRPSVSANLAGSPRSGKRPPSSAPHWINLWTRGRFCIGSARLSYRCCGFVGGACRTIAAQTSKHAGLTQRGHRASASAALGSRWPPPGSCWLLSVTRRHPPKIVSLSSACHLWPIALSRSATRASGGSVKSGHIFRSVER